MSILKLTPACTDYIWGGSKLREKYGIESNLNPLAEAWVLSAHPDNPSLLPDGTAFPAYLAANPGVLGTACEKFEMFPVLVKLIDAKKDLSIQVHPSDAYALANEGQYGKTEMWYVLETEPGSGLYVGFDREISREEYARRIADNTLLEVLHKEEVKPGDVIFIPSGTIHAICAGIMVAEVQQNSNITYRVYDYGRLGADGKPRALHIEKALEVTKRAPWEKKIAAPHLAECDYFTADLLNAPCGRNVTGESFANLLCVDGCGEITCGGETVQAKKGDSFFLPAGSGEFALTGSLSVLMTTVR